MSLMLSLLLSFVLINWRNVHVNSYTALRYIYISHRVYLRRTCGSRGIFRDQVFVSYEARGRLMAIPRQKRITEMLKKKRRRDCRPPTTGWKYFETCNNTLKDIYIYRTSQQCLYVAIKLGPRTADKTLRLVPSNPNLGRCPASSPWYI